MEAEQTEKLNEKAEEAKEGTTEEGSSTLWQKFRKELKVDRRLIPLKFLALLFYGGMFASAPYYTLHMQQLGLTVKEIAVIYTVLPIPGVAGPVFSGMLADWTSNFNAVLSANIVFTILFSISTVFTPTSPIPASKWSVNATLSAVSTLSCDGDFTNFKEWSCQTNCFQGFSHQAIFGNDSSTLDILCGTVTNQNQMPAEGCHLVSPLDPEGCHRTVSFINTQEVIQYYKMIDNSAVHSTGNCSVECNVDKMDELQDSEMTNSLTFWVYFFLRIITQFFVVGSFTMMDASIMAVMVRQGSDYGKQRIIAMISLATMPFLASCIVSAREGPPDYSVVFYLSGALLGCSLIMIQRMDLSVEEKKEDKDRNLVKEIIVLMRHKKVFVFIIVMLLLGSNWGFLESFFFVFLSALGAPPYLLGLTMTFGCLIGIPMLLCSDRMVEYFGREKIFFIGFVAYFVRMFGYSVITNPWYCFIFESLEIFTYQLMWVAAVTFFPLLAPPHLLGTLTGVAGSVHYNIGRGLGSLLGGFLISSVGLVWTFRTFGITSLIFAFVYLFLQKKVLNKPKVFVEDEEVKSKCFDTEETLA